MGGHGELSIDPNSDQHVKKKKKKKKMGSDGRAGRIGGTVFRLSIGLGRFELKYMKYKGLILLIFWDLQ